MGRKFIVEFEEDVDISCDDLVRYIKDGMADLGWLIVPKIGCNEVEQ